MVSKITKNAILSIKKNIDSYAKEMTKLQEKISVIDEKYRKMAEEAKKDLTNEYSSLEAEQEIWQSSLSRYGDDVVNEVLGEENASTTEDENSTNDIEEVSKTDSEKVEEQTVTDAPVEEVVVDTIFPENNEPVLVNETEPETPGEEPEEGASADEQPSEEQEALNELWPEENASEEIKLEHPMTEEEAAQKEKEQWPDFPEEW